jgi:hypothetical protein
VFIPPFTPKEDVQPLTIILSHLSCEFTPEVLRARELADLAISGRTNDSEHKRFQLSYMVIANRKVHAEPVPRFSVLVFQVLTKPAAQVTS